MPGSSSCTKAYALPVAGTILFGMSPTWETTLPQIVVLALVVAEIALTEARNARQRRKSPA